MSQKCKKCGSSLVAGYAPNWGHDKGWYMYCYRCKHIASAVSYATKQEAMDSVKE